MEAAAFASTTSVSTTADTTVDSGRQRPGVWRSLALVVLALALLITLLWGLREHRVAGDWKDRAVSLEVEAATLASELDTSAASLDTARGELAALRADLDDTRTALDSRNTELSMANAQLDDVRRRTTDLQARAVALEDEIALLADQKASLTIERRQLANLLDAANTVTSSLETCSRFNQRIVNWALNPVLNRTFPYDQAETDAGRAQCEQAGADVAELQRQIAPYVR